MRQRAAVTLRREVGSATLRPAENHLTSIGFALLDHDLCVTQANEVMAGLAGRPAGVLVGQRIKDAFPGASPAVGRALGRLVEGEKDTVVMIHCPPAVAGQARRGAWRLVFRAERGTGGRLTAVSVVATDVRALKGTRETARLRHAFQELLIGVSTALMNSPADRVDEYVRGGLRHLVEFLECDRALLSQTNRAGELVVTHVYSVPSFRELPRLNVDEAFPWLAEQVRNGRVLRVCDGQAEVPAEARSERAWMSRTGVRAHVTVPFSVAGGTICAISLTSRRARTWPPEVVGRLRLAGTIFINAVLRKQAEEDLQRARENLAHMGRVKTMGELASSIAHEVNQPLCAMVNNAQAAQRLLAGPGTDMADVMEALADIVADGKRAGEVIGRTRDMLKQHEVVLDAQDVNELILRVRPDLANYALLRQVRLETDLRRGIPAVRGHGVQIQQVVVNLLVNAVEAILPVRVGRGAGKGCVVISTRFEAAERAVVVRVSDNGRGLPSGEVERLFEPFYTSKPTGLGMGLAICRTIADAHGGKLWAERNPEGGAVFYFRLPAMAPAKSGPRRGAR